MPLVYSDMYIKNIICNTIAENFSSIFKRKIYCSTNKNYKKEDKYIPIEINIVVGIADRNHEQIIKTAETIHKALKSINILSVNFFTYRHAYIQCDFPNNIDEIKNILTIIKLQNS